MRETEQSDSHERFADSGNFLTLDFKIAAGLSKIIKGEFKRRVQLVEEQANNKNRMLTGRQIAWMIYNHLVTNVEDQVTLDFEDLLSVKLHGDNLFAFMNDREQCLEGFKNKSRTEYHGVAFS